MHGPSGARTSGRRGALPVGQETVAAVPARAPAAAALGKAISQSMPGAFGVGRSGGPGPGHLLTSKADQGARLTEFDRYGPVSFLVYVFGSQQAMAGAHGLRHFGAAGAIRKTLCRDDESDENPSGGIYPRGLNLARCSKPVRAGVVSRHAHTPAGSRNGWQSGLECKSTGERPSGRRIHRVRHLANPVTMVGRAA
ncbi:hypothetical protein [Burkholderia glumae]|uniref:hypothetical protein n=1 Tax=Burkholderia glumae TaxID=337 RepID=UPI0012FD7299|nr:hypothetical protein [Burkholderia glumae]QHE11661.1 hypothetical protein GQR88_15420 [Burkholderia glumae AU6208]